MTGFQARVSQDPDGRIVVAFADTGPTSMADWATDVIGAASVTPQDVEALLHARRVVAAHPSAGILMTGHSLGGRLAAEASIATGHPAVTLNAAGVCLAAHLFASGGGPHDPGKPWWRSHAIVVAQVSAQALLDRGDMSIYAGLRAAT
ncbi:MAG: hypothetical protein FWF75_00350 [Propionibacteriaceae bacterium]|nr:hypothetical protein [Propionibacteriaceae bacterium]